MTHPRRIDCRTIPELDVVLFFASDGAGNPFPDGDTAFTSIRPLLREEWLTPHEAGHC